MNGDESIIREALVEGDLYYFHDIISSYRLNSVGSWTQRFKDVSVENRALHNLRYLYGLISFDNYTKKEFREYIYKDIIRSISGCGYTDKKMFKELRKYFHIKSLDILKDRGLKSYILYILSIFNPRLVKRLIKLRYQKKQTNH